jgi:plasmid stability protein
VSTTITVRTGKELRDALAKRAAARGETVSELVRRILEAALSDRPLGARVGHLKGRLSLPRAPAGSWRDEIRRRNWRR